MDDPKKYQEWCKHYGYKPYSPEANEDWRRYNDNLARFQSILNDDKTRKEISSPDEKLKTETSNIWNKVDSINQNRTFPSEKNLGQPNTNYENRQIERHTHGHEMDL